MIYRGRGAATSELFMLSPTNMREGTVNPPFFVVPDKSTLGHRLINRIQILVAASLTSAR